MAPVNFSEDLYKHCMDKFSGPVTFTALKSQAGTIYQSRGIYGTEAIDIIATDGSIISDQKTILDIREVEFAVLPIQGDRVFLAANDFANQLSEDTTFEILDADANGGGVTTLSLRKIVPAKP